MLFRPNFCANCGEKVERIEWGIFTSRRFCQACELEFKPQDWMPRIAVMGGILLAVFGFGGYLKKEDSRSIVADKRPMQILEKPVQPGPIQAANVAVPLNSPPQIAATPVVRTQTNVEPKPAPPLNATANEQHYYCGAETKKGTPCSRKVKGNVRCFQHKGMTAMLPADKLKAE